MYLSKTQKNIVSKYNQNIETFEWIGLKKYVKNLFRYIGLN